MGVDLEGGEPGVGGVDHALRLYFVNVNVIPLTNKRLNGYMSNFHCCRK
jgi:hypothetical protein